MIGYSVLQQVFENLLHGNFVYKIYHDVIILEKDKNRYPAFPRGDEYIYVGVDDTKKMNCYIRQTGEARNIKTEFFSGCAPSYKVRVPYRLVFFNDFEKRNFDDLNARVINSLFVANVEFLALITDRKRIQQEENLIRNFTFGARTYYVAVDFSITIQLLKDTCDEVIGCAQLANPICFLPENSAGVLLFNYGFADEPFGDGSNGTIDVRLFNYQYNGSFLAGANLITQFPGMPINQYIAIEYPAFETDKTRWTNIDGNYGTIPDFVFNNIFVLGNRKYITSRKAMTLNNNFTTVFS